MNQTQVNNFLTCLLQIDDLNYLDLHARAAAINGLNSHNHTSISPISTADDDHNHEHDHDHDHDEHSSSHDLLVAKVVAMAVLFCATTICGSIPFLLNRHFKWTETNTNARSAIVVKCLLYFGGGVLLCTTFLHLLPEVQETVELLQTCGSLPELTFALAEMLMCAGFFLMYLIEEVIHAWVHRNKKLLQQDEGAGAAFERGHSVRHSYLVKGKAATGSSASTMQLATAPPAKLDGSVVASDPPSTNQTNGNANGNGNFALSVQDLISNDLENQKYQQAQQLEQQSHDHKHDGYQQHDHHRHHHHGHSHHGHGHSHLPVGNGDDDDVVTSSLRGLFIVLALSLHELFEGMAIGLEGSAQSVWFMFGAVSAHKLVLAFCVGVELIVARTRRTLCFVYVLTFAIVSPIGIGIGILISHNDDASTPSIPSAVLQGLACGTLLYVVFFEILSKNRAGLGAYFALFVGFAVMFGLQQLGVDADGHGHSHGGCGSHPESSSSNSPTRSIQLEHQHLHHHHQHDHHESPPTQLPYTQDGNFEQQLQFLRQASQNLMQSNKKLN